MLTAESPTTRESTDLYQQTSDLAVVLALARYVTRKTFIDVGAEKGVFSQALFQLGFRGTLFEPFPAHLPALQALVGGTASQVFPWAIDEEDHEGLLHIAVAADGKPMNYFHSLHRDETNPWARHTKTVQCSCRSLGSLANERVIEASVGVLKIDTEGCDLRVVNGMGAVDAEVLVCEFVTPSLFPTWTSSFPEGLLRAARQRGYQECVAIKRFGPHEMVALNPAGFVDGQWGNLVFARSELFAQARAELEGMALRDEEKLVASVTEQHRLLVEKEAVIQSLVEKGKNR